MFPVVLLIALPAVTPLADSLVEKLSADSFDTRTRAEAQLEKMGEKAREALRRGARLADLEGRMRCQRLLARLGPGPLKPRIAKLIEGLGDDTFDTREGAGRELVEIGFEALPQLRLATRHSDLEIRNRAREAMRKIHLEERQREK
jgi:hypothetical protein